MKIPAARLETVYEQLRNSVGAIASVVESISRNRDVGKHDRHFSTRSESRFELREVGWAFSGAQFFLSGPPGFSYGVSLDSLVSIESPDSGTFIFTEHFETRLERLTTIRLATSKEKEPD